MNRVACDSTAEPWFDLSRLDRSDTVVDFGGKRRHFIAGGQFWGKGLAILSEHFQRQDIYPVG